MTAITHCTICKQETNGHDIRVRADGRVVHVPCGEFRLFVYGSLRSGGALASMLPASSHSEPATLAGYALAYATHHRSFPYLVPAASATTVGELVTIPNDDPDDVRAVQRIAQMEVNAGYTIVSVPLATKCSDAPVQAEAFVWYGRNVGEPVPGNDWAAAPEFAEIDGGGFRQAESSRGDAPGSESAPTFGAGETATEKVRLTLMTRRGRTDDGGGGAILALGDDGTVIERFTSYTAAGRWAKQNNVEFIRTTTTEEV